MQPNRWVQSQAILGLHRGKLVGHEPVATDPQLHPHRRDRQHCRRGPHPGISATAVGQNINRLEAHLGVRLLNRSTRQLALSEAGALYLAQVRHIEADLARAQAMVTSGDIEPAGPLRIASSSAFGRHVLAPLLPSLQQRYPQLQLELRLTDRAVQHGPEAVDASIRIGAQLEDGWSRGSWRVFRSYSAPRRPT